MSGWTYYRPVAGDPHPEIEPDVLDVGARELKLMLQARRASSGSLVLPHDRQHNADRLAARRLTIRGLLTGPKRFGSSSYGWTYAYALTEHGRGCWLRTKSGA